MNTHTVCILLYKIFPLNDFIKPFGFVIVIVFFIKALIIKQLTIVSNCIAKMEVECLEYPGAGDPLLTGSP